MDEESSWPHVFSNVCDCHECVVKQHSYWADGAKRMADTFFKEVRKTSEDPSYCSPTLFPDEVAAIRKISAKENLDKGRYVYPTFTLSQENHALAEDVLVERIDAILKAKENKPKYYFCAFEKTEKGVWHIHALLYYEKSGHQGLGRSFFRRYWKLGYIHLEPVTVDVPSITRISTYLEKQPHLKIGSKEMILKPLKATPTP